MKRFDEEKDVFDSEGHVDLEAHKRTYQNKLRKKLDLLLKKRYGSKKNYIPDIKYVEGIARGFSYTYSKQGMTVEDLEQECYWKLLYGDREELKKALYSDTRGLLGTIIRNHLTDKSKKVLVKDALWGAVPMDTGDPIPIKDIPMDEGLYEEHETANEKERKREARKKKTTKFGEPLIELKNRRDLTREDQALISGKRKDSPDTMLFNIFGGTGIVLDNVGKIRLEVEGDKYIGLYNSSFENSLVEKIDLQAQLDDIKKDLDDFGKRYVNLLSITMNYPYKQMARTLKTYDNKIIRLEKKVMKLLISYRYKNDPQKEAYYLKEYEMILKAYKENKTIAYWTGE